MAYTVLARKYRSRTFDEVIGQEPIATTLSNAIEAGRIHHGYLFTGVRGTGKTSLARILAKSLNCLNSDKPTIKPCLKCDACISIAEGQDIDVLEIDAASNTGVDNIRELRSNTAFRPARSRFKIYIIDEVHMLSTGAFNALLKTLEEPPEHVKFILATTEIQKVPATIQSRCQRFNFRHIAPDDIVKRLKQILKAEHADASDDVIWRVARLAGGSMRDALSILDQLLSISSEKLTTTLLDQVLPPAHDEQALKIITLAAACETAEVLTLADQVLSSGRGNETFCNDLIETAHTLMLVRSCGADARLVELPADAKAEYVKLAGQFELSQYVQMIAMLEELRRGVRFSSAGRALLDAALVRLANLRRWAPIERLLTAAPGEAEKKKLAPADPTAAGPRSVPIERVEPVTPRPVATATAAQVASAARDVAPPSRTATAPTSWSTPESAPRLAKGSSSVAAPAVTPMALSRNLTPPTPGTNSAAPPSGSSELRARALRDPLVQQVLECFDATIVNIERLPTSGAPPEE